MFGIGIRSIYTCSFSGRGQKSHAYTHSVQDSHHVFLNLETMKFYCLPDNYQIIDQSLEDIVVSNNSNKLVWCLDHEVVVSSPQFNFRSG